VISTQLVDAALGWRHDNRRLAQVLMQILTADA